MQAYFNAFQVGSGHSLRCRHTTIDLKFTLHLTRTCQRCVKWLTTDTIEEWLAVLAVTAVRVVLAIKTNTSRYITTQLIRHGIEPAACSMVVASTF